MKMRNLPLALLFVSLLTAHDSQLTTAFAAQEPVVRVAVLQEVQGVRVTVLAPCRLKDLATGSVLGQWSDLKWQAVEAGNPGIKISSIQTESRAVLLEPRQEAILRINARPYRGSLIFIQTPRGRLTVINRLGLEEYLVGALGSEVNPAWPAEALKAHAVVSRTMIAHRIWISQDLPFDVTADTETHLYHGVSGEREQTRAAVQATQWQVLAYQGELLSAAFHANCGGHTEDAAELWQVRGDLAPLKGRPDPYCKGLRHFHWRTDLSAKELMKRLGEGARGVGDLNRLEILERNDSGRVRRVRLKGSSGGVTLPGKKFRELLGANRLRSLNFNVRFSDGTVSFDGFGWGHGVGLCQWGAYGMAVQGRTMDEILDFYFPGAHRRDLKGLPGFPANS
ncbi:MAG: SpoIID/LytB domain-containing protein [Candidatus Omnitrophica bacterium]|nr:SpoIID/LytB domain-containing protein [Candidatus Omnitrophota bacterium]